MNRCWRRRGLTNWSTLFFLLLASGCSNPAGLRNDAAPADKEVPFHDQESSASGSNPPASLPAKSPSDDKAANGAGLEDAAKVESDLPFRNSRTVRDSQSLPAGTLLTVRLSELVSADHPEASGKFGAVVDEPVIVEGNVLVPRGVPVKGRIESARASEIKQNRGYLRLTLESMDLAGNEFAVQTSSLFASGTPEESEHPPAAPSASSSRSTAPVTLEKGRRLTFRITEPVYIASPHTATSR
jgi:hypothetical protein